MQLAYDTFLHCCICHGGVTYIKEALELEAGCHVLIATPGRLMDHIEHERITLAAIQYVGSAPLLPASPCASLFIRFISRAHTSCRTLVIDEGDRMLDMGFEPQLRAIVTAHDMTPRAQRQTLFFSATFPGAVREVALSFLRPGHVTVRVGRVGTTVRTVKQTVIDAEGQSKRALLMQLLDSTDDGLAVVFAETKAEVRSLERFLLNERFSVVSLHGDKTQPVGWARGAVGAGGGGGVVGEGGAGGWGAVGARAGELGLPWEGAVLHGSAPRCSRCARCCCMH